MTGKEMAQLIGKTGRVGVASGQVQMDVRVVDVKQAYGTTRVLLEPVAGTGQAWTIIDRFIAD